MGDQQKKRVVILGGGFGGAYAAMRLDKCMGRDESVEITLVNRENFFLFTPMLHEVAASDLEITDIVSPIRELVRHVRFFCGEVESVDLAGKKVTVTHGNRRHSHQLDYDALILALGSTTDFTKLPGSRENSLAMKSLGDAIELRNRVIDHLEEADTECAAEHRAALMTFVVAGGGFAGVETIASVNDMVRASLRFYPHIEAKSVRIVIIHHEKEILPELGPELGAYAHQKLAKRGVEILTNSTVAQVTENSVTLGDGTVIPTRTLIWTAGNSVPSLVTALPCDNEKGRIKVNEFLEIPKWPGVFALGDCAMVPNLLTGGYQPETAQHAIREAKVAADNAIAYLRGGAKKPFQYQTIGSLASIGHRTGVARIFGVNFSGFAAWWLWRTVYLSKLPRVEKKVRVAIDWTMDLLFPKDLVQFLTDRAQTISRQ